MAQTTETFPCADSSVTRARHAVVAFLEREGCADRESDTAALLVSELATNAVRHAKTRFTIDMRHDAGTLEVDVGDDDPRLPDLRVPDVEGGRGLRIVDALADEWGVRIREPGKVVSFRLAC